LKDYRDLPDSSLYDKIASVGMFEHVGLKNLGIYFSGIRSHLKPGGLFLNHGITTADVNNRPMAMGVGEFIGRYVFPHGELPHLSLVIREMAKAGLEPADVESLRRHYARTCRIWADRLESTKTEAARLAGDRRFRIWEVYLAGCAYGFAHGWMNIYQVLGCRAEDAESTSLPMTRRYQYMHTGQPDHEPQGVVGEPCP
jgi:cyclopropane-fatty-acyl-phospholipid synthase